MNKKNILTILVLLISNVAHAQKISIKNSKPAEKYKFMGKIVYYTPAAYPDDFGTLTDEKGKFICHPDGGISGAGDGKCPGNFFKLREKLK